MFLLCVVCVCVRALSLDKPQSGVTDAASRTLLQQEKKNKTKNKKSRKGKIAGGASEPTGLYFLRAARETKLALGAAPFMKERRWVEHNLQSSSLAGYQGTNTQLTK